MSLPRVGRMPRKVVPAPAGTETPLATETADIADAHVVVCARRAGPRVVTSDPDDLARFDPDLELVIV